MGLIHEVNTRTHFVDGRLHSQRHGVESEEELEHHFLDAERLFWAFAVDGENINYMQGHMLLKWGFAVSKFRWKPHVVVEEKLTTSIS